MAQRHEDLADAYLKVAEANHYMVGIVGDISRDDRERAHALLVDRENEALDDDNGPDQRIAKLALDLLEHDMQQATTRASQGTARRLSDGV